MNVESIKELLQKINRLAEEGADGEREAAQNALNKLLVKHNLTLEDIRDDVRFCQEFTVTKTDKFVSKLTLQIVANLAPMASESLKVYKAHGNSNSRTYIGNFTKAEWADVSDAIEHFIKDFTKQVDEFYSAYIQKNRLWSNEKNIKGKSLTPEEMARVMAKMRGIDAVERVRKLENA